VQAFDPLCEVQSDKASVEITSPFEGVIRELLVKEGEIAKVGDGLCVIEVADEGDTDAQTEPLQISVAHQPDVVVKQQQSTSRTSSSTTTLESKARQPHPLDPSTPPKATGSSKELATPSVRHYAREKGIDITEIGSGSGKGGRIERSDIDAYLMRGTGAGQPGATALTASTQTSDHTIELGRTRMAMWKAMNKVSHFRLNKRFCD
jgi:2-oxoisovalerate dehydrogenase E2 component (dihydrolipoyl transacylase)